MSRLAGYSKVGETLPSAMFGNFELRVMGNVVLFLPKDFVPGSWGFSLGFQLLERPCGIWLVCRTAVSVILVEMDKLFFLYPPSKLLYSR